MSIAALLEDASRAARDAPERIDLLNAMGLSRLMRSDVVAARVLFERARGLCEGLEDPERGATCVLNLAEVALRAFDHDLARREFARALALYRRRATTSALQGEANCLLGLAQVDLRASRTARARERFEGALALYAAIEDRLGVANCVKGLGDVAWRRADLDGALAHLADALTRHRAVHHVLGEASCLRAIGEVALLVEDGSLAADADAVLADALGLFASIENPLGQANCLRGRAELALDDDAADACLRAALALYRRAGCTAAAVDCERRLRAISRREVVATPRAWTPDDNA